MPKLKVSSRHMSGVVEEIPWKNQLGSFVVAKEPRNIRDFQEI